MTVDERVNDIANLAGVKPDVVRNVLKACQTSLVKSLRLGQRALLPGLCALNPDLTNMIVVEGGIPDLTRRVTVKASVSKSLMTSLSDIDDFEVGLDSDIYKIPRVAIHQLEELV